MLSRRVYAAQPRSAAWTRRLSEAIWSAAWTRRFSDGEEEIDGHESRIDPPCGQAHQYPHRGTARFRPRCRARAEEDALPARPEPRSAARVEGEGRAGFARFERAGGAGLHS